MLKFIIQKLIKKKWMAFSLLIGNFLLIAIACANPMYSDAVLQRTLTKDLDQYMVDTGAYPGAIHTQLNFSSYVGMKMKDLEQAEAVFEKLKADLNIPVLESVEYYHQRNVPAVPQMQVEGEKEEMVSQLGCYSNLEDHITMKYGTMFSDQIDQNVIEVVVNEKTFVENNMMMDCEFTLRTITDENDVPYRLKVVGVFQGKDESDPYWIYSPEIWSNMFIMDEDIYKEVVTSTVSGKKNQFIKNWYAVLDFSQMKADDVEEMLQVIYDSMEQTSEIQETECTINCLKVLEDFVPKARKLNTTITVLQIPIFMLLAAFIFMVAGQMLQMEQNEISVFKSRGISKAQIVGLYFMQSVLIAVLGIIGGIPLGVLICKIIGASNAFLEFVSRTALPVVVNTKALLFALTAAVLSVCTMVLPVFKYADFSIVAHKRQKSRKTKKVWWKTIFLDVILLAGSIYGLYRYNGQEDYLAQSVADGASLDPMLYICSSMFMLGASLLILRMLPWMIRLVFEIGKKWWSPGAYASFLRIIRADNNQGFIVVFLVLTVSMGIFSTQTARTININNEDRIRYSAGADLVLQEVWNNSAAEILAMNGTPDYSDLTYYEPDFAKYKEMEGIALATKVLVEENVSVPVSGGKLEGITVMGIHTKEFGQVAWMKDDLLSRHWYEYLNTISKDSYAILVSSNFKDIYGFKIGDVINYSNKSNDSVRGIICGFVDYWPTYVSQTTEIQKDGLPQQVDHFLIIAHLSQLQSSWGITPYQVWIDAVDSTQFMYEYAQKTGIKFQSFRDMASNLVDLKNDPVFQGTNGIFTIGFIVVLLLCATGFLIYWIMSIRSRTLQFGIFRAMGMSGGNILGMLFHEQLFISGSAILGGIIVGRICSMLFVPLIMIGYSSVDRVLPLEVISETNDYLRLGIVIGAMILVCMVILTVLISKIKVTQALKLGED